MFAYNVLMKWNLPTLLTLLRLVVIPIAVFFYYLPITYGHPIAASLVVVGGICDYLDGYLARRWNQTTAFGAFLDPVADKICIVVGFIVVSAEFCNLFITLSSIVIICREVIISALREWMALLGKHASVAVRYLGKVKTVIQGVALVILVWYHPGSPYWLFLAVACAVSALEKQLVSRIVLTRPAVEAGENLGFLPGDLTQKIDPYLRPLYDALYEMLGSETITRLISKGTIEIAPLAFMRGRTLNDSFVILDEGQNATKEQMKMFLTRIGFGSRAVITGDITQVDLPRKTESGLRHALSILRGINALKFTFFTSQDVVRHPLVQEIIEAYDEPHE